MTKPELPSVHCAIPVRRVVFEWLAQARRRAPKRQGYLFVAGSIDRDLPATAKQPTFFHNDIKRIFQQALFQFVQ